MPDSQVLIRSSALRAGYGSTVVIRSLDLEVNAGEVVVLLGPNGAGKTTTIRTLAGIIPALAGDVFLHGQRTRAPLDRRARAGLGLVTEERSIIRKLTVVDNLRVSRCDIPRAIELFPELKEHMSKKAGLLSGGQQQMLALARALARPTSILLIDELSLGLAPMVTDRLLAAVRSAADRGIGVLLVEQQAVKALAVADRAMLLTQGRIVDEGSAVEMRHRLADIQKAFLGQSLSSDV